MQLETLGLIGNCQFAGLVRNDGAIVWCCLPRFDSDPLFGELLDPEGGSFLVGPAEGGTGVQRYVENTNVLETTFETPTGSFRVTDFAPRFRLFDRNFRPTKIVRIIEPISGTPRVRVRCAPRLGWSKAVPREERGSNHVSYLGYSDELRLTTDVPLSYLEEGRSFALTRRRHVVLAWGAPVEEALAPLCDRFRTETVRYWQTWVKHSDIPPLYQQEVIRSALALKLHCFEDTGAIIASVTTSIPESKGSGRTWDYRYCWLRDAYYALDAFRLLGHFEEREGFVDFLLDVASSTPNLDLTPLYRVDGRHDLDERIEAGWAGYAGDGPVRVGNGAVQHLQHDVFGEMILALAPAFLDARFSAEQTEAGFDLLVRLAKKSLAVAGQPDASIWELRTEWTPQTFSGFMCWAGAERVSRVVAKRSPELAAELFAGAERVRAEILEQAWSEKLGAIASSYGGHTTDAALLQMAPLRFLPKDDPRLVATIDATRRALERDGWMRRYDADDGFGRPAVAFVICQFWLVEALAALGRKEEARTIFERSLAAQTPLGLIAEDWDPVAGRLSGNFPQAYSHVGLVHAAFASSPSWHDVL